MPNFAANLSWLYQEHAFLDRFAAAALSGFKAVEFLFPYAFKPGEIARKLAENNLRAVLFNLPPGDFDRGERGIAALPGREKDFQASLRLALEYAEALSVPRLHIMAGITSNFDPAKAHATYLANIQFALDQTARSERVITLEPINTRDFPGYFLTTIEQAASVLAELDNSRLKIQLDWYHLQIMGGDLSRRTTRFFPQVGHLQLAGVPDRGEPDRGEVNFRHLFKVVDELGYDGWIGCEYKPIGKTEEGLGWLRRITGDKG